MSEQTERKSIVEKLRALRLSMLDVTRCMEKYSRANADETREMHRHAYELLNAALMVNTWIDGLDPV